MAVIAVERDADLRGWQGEDERPGLAAALRRAEEDADVLLVWDLSRLARKLRIQENIVARLAESDVEIASLNEPWASAPKAAAAARWPAEPNWPAATVGVGPKPHRRARLLVGALRQVLQQDRCAERVPHQHRALAQVGQRTFGRISPGPVVRIVRVRHLRRDDLKIVAQLARKIAGEVRAALGGVRIAGAGNEEDGVISHGKGGPLP